MSEERKDDPTRTAGKIARRHGLSDQAREEIESVVRDRDAEIAALRKENEDLDFRAASLEEDQDCAAQAAHTFEQEAKRLRAEVAALRTALAPFAAVAETVPEDWPAECALTWGAAIVDSDLRAIYYGVPWGAQPRIADYRRASAALAGKEDPRG